MPAFSLPCGPPLLSPRLHSAGNAPLPPHAPHASPRRRRRMPIPIGTPSLDWSAGSAASVAGLSPGGFWAPCDSPGERLCTLWRVAHQADLPGVCAARPPLASHLSRTWGPWPAVWAVPLSMAEITPAFPLPGLGWRHSEFGSASEPQRGPGGGSGGSTFATEHPRLHLNAFRGEPAISGRCGLLPLPTGHPTRFVRRVRASPP